MTPRAMKFGLVALFACLALAGCGSREDDLAESVAVEVPDVVDLSRREARSVLAEVGLRYRYGGSEFIFSGPPDAGGYSTADDDRVTDQDPDAGERVERGSVVSLDVTCELPERPLEQGEACD